MGGNTCMHYAFVIYIFTLWTCYLFLRAYTACASPLLKVQYYELRCVVLDIVVLFLCCMMCANLFFVIHISNCHLDLDRCQKGCCWKNGNDSARSFISQTRQHLHLTILSNKKYSLFAPDQIWEN